MERIRTELEKCEREKYVFQTSVCRAHEATESVVELEPDDAYLHKEITFLTYRYFFWIVKWLTKLCKINWILKIFVSKLVKGCSSIQIVKSNKGISRLNHKTPLIIFQDESRARSSKPAEGKRFFAWRSNLTEKPSDKWKVRTVSSTRIFYWLWLRGFWRVKM